MELEKAENGFRSDEKGDPEKQSLHSSGESPSISIPNKENKGLLSKIVRPIEIVRDFCGLHSNSIFLLMKGTLYLLYFAYFIWALVYDLDGAVPLICFTSFVALSVAYEMFNEGLKRRLKGCFESCCSPNSDTTTNIKRWSKVILYIGVFAALVWLIVDIIRTDPGQLRSGFGVLIIVLVCLLFSKYPGQISWRPVVWGIFLQFVLGLFVLRTDVGYNIIDSAGTQVVKFMAYTNNGTDFVFSNTGQHYFAFKILPMIIFFSTVTNVLNYLGLTSWFIAKLAWLTQITLGVSAIESTVAVANIFVGMTEAPLVVRPYLDRLTKAEVHSVMCSGLGSIAFGVVGPYMGLGVNPVHLLTACVMTAPATLVISRLLYPETEKSEFHGSLQMEKGTDRNVVEAAAAGASMSISLVANIAANLISFIALVAFLNAAVSWFGGFIGYPLLSFKELCGYLFVPVAFLMGVEFNDCLIVGELIGLKTFLNEFVAYQELGHYIDNRKNGIQPFITERSEAITTHALCGFCNVGSLGIIISGLGVLMPTKKKELADSAVRALVGAMLACFMTASIAGMLYKPSIDEVALAVSTIPFNFTTVAPNSTTVL